MAEAVTSGKSLQGNSVTGCEALQAWSGCIGHGNRCWAVLDKKTAHMTIRVPTNLQLTPHLEAHLIHCPRNKGHCRLSKAVSPGIIEGRGFVMNRVLGFMIDKKRHVCQD